MRNSAIHALTLQRTPDRIFTDMVIFTVTPNSVPMIEALPNNIAQAFSLQTVAVTPIEKLLREEISNLPSPEQTQEAFAVMLKCSRQLRAKGYLGQLVLLVTAPGIGYRGQLVALDLEWMLDEATYPVDRQWEQTLRNELARTAMSVP